MKKSLRGHCLFCIWFFASLLAMSAFFTTIPAAQACEPEPPIPDELEFNTLFPADGAEDIPLDAAIAVSVGVKKGYDNTSYRTRVPYDTADFQTLTWPNSEDALESVYIELRQGTDLQEGSIKVDQKTRQVRFVPSQPLLPNTPYSIALYLSEASYDDVWPSLDELDTSSYLWDRQTFRFTTGNRTIGDEPLEFRTSLSLAMTQYSLMRREICVVRQSEYCNFEIPVYIESQWGYLPQANVRIHVPASNLNPDGLLYTVYLTYPNTIRPDKPIKLYRPTEIGPQVIRAPLYPDFEGNTEPGPWCFRVEAMDVFGNTYGGEEVVCAAADEIVPIPRLEEPQPDLSECVDENGVSTIPDENNPDTHEENVNENGRNPTPTPHPKPENIDGCQTTNPSIPTSWTGAFFLLSLLLTGALIRKPPTNAPHRIHPNDPPTFR